MTFADMAGIDAMKAEVQEIVDYFEDPMRYRQLGASVSHDVRLTGQSGAGNEDRPRLPLIDDLDAIGRARRATAIVGDHDERKQTLNPILSVTDGLSGTQWIVALTTTNPPDHARRQQFLRVHARTVALADDVDLAELARATPGMVCGELRNLVNEAALLAARRNHDRVTRADFSDALEKIVLGTRPQDHHVTRRPTPYGRR